MSSTGWINAETVIGQWTNKDNALTEDGNFATLETEDPSSIFVESWTDETSSMSDAALSNWGSSNVFMEIVGHDWEHEPPLELDQLDSLSVELLDYDSMSSLVLRGFDFSEIPANSSIDGLDVRVKGYKSGGTFYVDVVQVKVHYTLTTGWKSPGTAANAVNGGDAAWTNVDNIKTSNNSYSTATKTNSAVGEKTQCLQATNFGFNIPAGSTINGIEVVIEEKASHQSSYLWVADYVSGDGGVFIIKSDGTIGTTNRGLGIGDKWATTDTEESYGSSTDLWGETWSASDINDSDFGVCVQPVIRPTGADVTAYVDHIQMKVYYTEGTEANSERKLYTQGRLTGNSEKKLYTQGFNVGNSNRPLYAQGTLEGSSERGLYLQGCLTNNSGRTLYIEGYAGDYYSKESSSDLETNDTPLTTQFSEQEYTTVRTDDDNYVDLQGTAQYMKFLFKELNENETNEQKFNIIWRGKSSLAPSSATVYLQVYNRTSGLWETLDSDSTTSANTKFTLTGTKSTNLSGYYDSNYVISVRVYQDVT